MNLTEYEVGDFYDEMIQPNGEPRQASSHLAHNLQSLSEAEIMARQSAADLALVRSGITFNVYSDNRGVEKTLPFDLIPRIVAADEWQRLEAGLKQRITALNLFIDDLYHDQRIIKDGVIPCEVIESSKGFHKQCVGLKPPRGIWCHITGTDLVRNHDGRVYVLEDNMRCPSGVLMAITSTSARSRSPSPRPPFAPMPRAITVNSSPPYRANTSSCRSVPAIVFATDAST